MAHYARCIARTLEDIGELIPCIYERDLGTACFELFLCLNSKGEPIHDEEEAGGTVLQLVVIAQIAR